MLMPGNVKLYLYAPPTDMRKSIDTLCILVSEILKMTPTDGHIFLFRNRSGNKLKALYYETNCFTLCYRRLETGKFVFPKDAEGHIEIDRHHFEWLLASDKYSRINALKQQDYLHYS
jgi:transposase